MLRSYHTYCDAELDIILDIDISNASSSEFGNNYCSYNHLSACFYGRRLAHGIICYGDWYLGKFSTGSELDRKWTKFRCHCVWHMYLLQWLSMLSPILSKNQKLIDWQGEYFQFHSPYLGKFSVKVFIQMSIRHDRWTWYENIKRHILHRAPHINQFGRSV